MFCRDVPERTVTFDVVGIEVFRLASLEESALPANRAIAETLELFADDFYTFDSRFPSLFIKPWFCIG